MPFDDEKNQAPANSESHFSADQDQNNSLPVGQSDPVESGERQDALNHETADA